MSRRARLKAWLRRVGKNTRGLLNLPTPTNDWRRLSWSLRRILSKRGYPKNSDLNWALCRACNLGHEDVVRALLAHGVSPSAPSSFKRQDLPESSTPLHIAVQAQHVDIVKLLAENGADANARDEPERTPLHYAAGRDVIIILLKHGAALDARDRAGDTPLDAAMRSGRHRAIMELLAQGATPTVPVKPRPTMTVTETIKKLTPAEVEWPKDVEVPRLHYSLFWRR